MITIIDYGLGNLGSIHNMFKYLGVESQISSNLEVIKRSPKLLLPGVGAFDLAMKKIGETGLGTLLNERVLNEKTPILGICLGMQLLTRSSEEGQLKGLGWIDASTKRFPSNQGIKIPHMGWNEVQIATASSLTNNLPENPRYYFVHSYYVEVDKPEESILKCLYGDLVFDAAVQKGNVYGAQFHPEKSHKFGMALLKNFADLPC